MKKEFTPRQRRKLTPKQRVLRKYPNSFARYERISAWCVQSGSGAYLAICFGTPRAAWADAARSLNL